MINGEGVGQGDPRQESIQAPRIPIHVDGVSLGLKREELAACPPADDRDKLIEGEAYVDPRLSLGEKVVRALSYMRDVRLFSNGMSKPDSNRAPEENVDEERRAPRLVVKERALRGNVIMAAQITETVLTGRRARFEATKATPISEAEKSTDDEIPEVKVRDESDGAEIYVASKDKLGDDSLAPLMADALAEANRIGPMYMPIEICSLDEMREHVQGATPDERLGDWDYAATAEDLRSQ